MEHTNHIKNQKIRYSIFTKNPITLHIIKQIPITIETRLSNHSSNETVFRHAEEDYEKALNKSGYNVKLQCKPTRIQKTT